MPAKTTRQDERDIRFFAALENGHPVRAACEMAGYARRCVYRWRKEDPAFAAQWAEAQQIAGDLLEEEADRRGRDGYDEAVFFRGEKCGDKRKYSDGLLLARLKAIRPDQYRDRIAVPGMGQQSVTVVIRDFDAEDTMLRLVAEKKMTIDDLPARLRLRLNES